MNDLMKFEFDGYGVRAIKIEENPWFVAADVARALNFRDAANAVRSLDEDEKGTRAVSTPGGSQNVTIINESGLFSLMLKSQKPEAKRFKKWVTGTVLPAIRKDGGYIAGEEKVATGELHEDELVLRAITVLQRKVERLALERDTAMEAVRTAAPKVAFHDAVRDVVNSIAVGDFAKELGIGEIRFFKWLRKHGILLSSKSHWNQPAQRYVDQGYFRLNAGRPYKTTAGDFVQGDPRPVITGKGQIWLEKKWRGEDPQTSMDLNGGRS